MTKKDGDATPLPPEGQDMTGSALYKVFVADTSFRAESLHIFALVRSQQVIHQIGRLDPLQHDPAAIGLAGIDSRHLDHPVRD